MSAYSVVLYLDSVKMTFSVTARKSIGARLEEVKQQQLGPGKSQVTVLSGVTEAVAIRQKRLTVATQRAYGFRKVRRRKLS